MNGTAWNGYPMARRGSFLLSDGDVLALSPESQLMFCSDSCMEEENIEMVQQVEMEVSAFLPWSCADFQRARIAYTTQALSSQYVITPRKLGSGAYGQVYMAFQKETGQQFACKVVDFRRVRARAVDEQRGRKSSFFAEATGSSCKVVAVRERKRYLSKKIQEKLEAYNREGMILERLCHVSCLNSGY